MQAVSWLVSAGPVPVLDPGMWPSAITHVVLPIASMTVSSVLMRTFIELSFCVGPKPMDLSSPSLQTHAGSSSTPSRQRDRPGCGGHRKPMVEGPGGPDAREATMRRKP